MRFSRVFIQAVLIILSAGCQPPDGPKKFTIVCTTGIINDAVHQIFGDMATVESIMGTGVDPHLYKASHGDINKLSNADIVIHNGLHLEGKMSDLLHKLSETKNVFAMSDGADVKNFRKLDASGTLYDPHIWFDVPLWRQCVGHIGRQIIDKLPKGKDQAEIKLLKYLSDLDSLDHWVRNEMIRIPPEKRVLITSHDAFEYFGKAYGIKVKGLQGISTLSEFGLRDVTELVDFVIENNVKTLFIETSVSPRSIESVINGCHSKNFEVKIGGSLFSDALGSEGTTEGTYVGMIKHNVNLMTKGWQ
jgi:manganese/zinc/iron transport system substrate-binding protein